MKLKFLYSKSISYFICLYYNLLHEIVKSVFWTWVKIWTFCFINFLFLIKRKAAKLTQSTKLIITWISEPIFPPKIPTPSWVNGVSENVRISYSAWITIVGHNLPLYKISTAATQSQMYQSLEKQLLVAFA